MNILIVEDARDQRLLLSVKLKKIGHQVTEAENGVQAIDLLNSRPEISMIISDWMMPEMDGIQLCKLIKQADFSRYLYFILLTGKTEKNSLVEGINAGADDFISKPVDFGELEARLKAGGRLIELERALDEKNQALSNAITTIGKDLTSAAQTLSGLLAQPETINNITFDWFFKPCKHLGGDMLGYEELDKYHVFFYQLDVAGHGVPSALLSFTLNHVLSKSGDTSLLRDNPVQVLKRLNQRFQTTTEQTLYFTMVYGVINSKTGKVTMAQAGHPSPLWLQKESQTIEPVGGRGVPVGMLPETEYQSVNFKLQPGDRLFLYSDGLTECANARGELFDSQRLCQLLEQSFSGSVRESIRQVGLYIDQWHQQDVFEDDITYLLLEWNS